MTNTTYSIIELKIGNWQKILRFSRKSFSGRLYIMSFQPEEKDERCNQNISAAH
jgi:hypothetical protein